MAEEATSGSCSLPRSNTVLPQDPWLTDEAQRGQATLTGGASLESREEGAKVTGGHCLGAQPPPLAWSQCLWRHRAAGHLPQVTQPGQSWGTPRLSPRSHGPGST